MPEPTNLCASCRHPEHQHHLQVVGQGDTAWSFRSSCYYWEQALVKRPGSDQPWRATVMCPCVKFVEEKKS